MGLAERLFDLHLETEVIVAEDHIAGAISICRTTVLLKFQEIHNLAITLLAIAGYHSPSHYMPCKINHVTVFMANSATYTINTERAIAPQYRLLQELVALSVAGNL